MRQNEDGSGSVLMLGIIAVVCTMALAVTAMGAAVTAKSTAQTAADLAALAGAQALIDGFDSTVACRTAGSIASANQARLTNCQVDADASLTVEVTRSIVGAPGSVLANLKAVGRARAGRPF